MLSYYDIAGVKIRYDSEDAVTDEAALFFAATATELPDLDITENRFGRLLIPGSFVKSYEQGDQLNCFASPDGELIIQMGLNRNDGRRDGSYRARLSADMSSAEIDFTPYRSNDGISGTLGRFIYECHVMRRGWLPMHAVSVDTGGGAILFSGVSGAGKSTQAELWAAHSGSRIINGDRAPLIPEGSGYATAGTAWSGTSQIYTKLRAPVKAIIFIEQAKENTIKRLTRREAFENIVKHCAVPYYHAGLLNRVMDTIDALTAAVPMYYLRNRADAECYRITREALAGSI